MVSVTITAADADSDSSSGGNNRDGSSGNRGVRYFTAKTNAAEARGCLDTLVAALEDDPINCYMTGSRTLAYVRDEVWGYLKAVPEAHHFLHTPDMQAVALWQLLPEETPKNEMLAGWKRIFKVPVKRWSSLLDMELHYEAQHDRVYKEHGSYYYLSYIGTSAESRGKGYGSQLLKHMTDKADQEQRYCLLEATSDRSKALYERHGFMQFEAYRVRAKAPPVFFMLRVPQMPLKLQLLAAEEQLLQAAAKSDTIAAVRGDEHNPAAEEVLISAVGCSAEALSGRSTGAAPAINVTVAQIA